MSICAGSRPSCGSRLNAQGAAGGMRSCLHAVSKDLMVGGAAYSSDPQAFAAHVASGLSDELKRVLLIHCEVQSDLWSVHDERLIELFLEWWATLPLANVNTRPVLLFKLIGQREGLRRGFSLFGGTRPAITDFVRRLDPQRFPQLRLVKLPVLDSIMASDLADWAESVFEHLAAARVPHAAIVKQAAPRLIGPDGRKKPLDEVSRLLKQLIDNRDFAEKWARGEGR